MRIVIVAPPTINVSAMAKDLAAKEKVALVTDPSRAACERYGFQTLYEMPLALQKKARRKLIADHIADLKKNGSAVYDHSVFQWLADWMRWLWSETPSEEWEAVLAEAGDVILSKAAIYAEAGEIFAGTQPKPAAGSTIVFKSVGLAVEDVTAAKLVYELTNAVK